MAAASSSLPQIALDRFATFGDLLRYLRRRAGLTQRELAIAVGYDHTQISRLEQNRRVPDPATLAARFGPALEIDGEREVVRRLLELAAIARLEEAKSKTVATPPGPAGRELPRQERGLPLGRLHPSRLVGRIAEQRRLAEHLDRLSQGEGSVMLLSGEPGIGKTRLLDETIVAARARGFQVLTGRCHERDVATPYLPFADALEAYARRCTPATWKRLMDAAGLEIGVLLSDDFYKYVQWGGPVRPETSALLTVQAEARPTRALRNLLYEMGREAPVVVVVDDLHWSDPPSLELFYDLAVHARELSICLLGAYREVELGRSHPLSLLLVELNRERLLARERLRRLDAAETAALLAELLGGPPPPSLGELIYEQTEGNPFFIEELVNGLVEAGRLVWDEPAHGYDLAPGITIEVLAGQVPQGIRAAIGSRLDHLEPTTQQVLGLASVIGRLFSLEGLSQLAAEHQLSEAEVERAIAQAQAARFLTALDTLAARRENIVGFTAGAPGVEADYAFEHPLLHQVVYAELDRRRRRRVHAEVGYLLEDRYRGRTVLYAERLAYHFLESDDEAQALQYSLMAGDKMMRGYYDADLALGYYLAALQMVIGQETALRHLAGASPVPLRHGVLHRFTADEREAVVAYLAEVLQAVGESPVAPAVGQLASRICVVALHTGEVYEASIRLYERHRLGPDAQKLVVDTERGRLVGILQFPGPGGPYPVVVMFHGWPGSKENLADEARRYLARGLATLRVDLPGFGETTVPMTHSLADAEILQAMLTAVLAHDRVDPRGVSIVGFSFGPWYGAHLCARDDRILAMVSISGAFDPLDTRPGIWYCEAVWNAFSEAQWKAGKSTIAEAPYWAWGAEASVYPVAHQIRCPVLLVYGALEPEKFRVNAEELAALVPRAKTRVWRSGVHVLYNMPEALEDAADWMKQQVLGAKA